MANKSKKKQTTKNKKQGIKYEIKLTLLIASVVFLLLALFTNTTSFVGAFISDLLKGLFGSVAFATPLIVFLLFFATMNPNLNDYRKRIIIATSTLAVALMLFNVAYQYQEGGKRIFSQGGITYSFHSGRELTGAGLIPQILFDILEVPLGITGVWLTIITLIMIFLIYSFDITPTKIGKLLGRSALKTKDTIASSGAQVGAAVSAKIKEGREQELEEVETKRNQQKLIKLLNDEDFTAETKAENYAAYSDDSLDADYLNHDSFDDNLDAITIIDYDHDQDREQDSPFSTDNTPEEVDNLTTEKTKAQKSAKLKPTAVEINAVEHEIEERTEISYENYTLPSVKLLKQGQKNKNKRAEQEILDKAKLLEKTLMDFKVNAKVIQVSRGPMITRFEIQPSAGVKVSKIVNLSDDIALRLAATSVRIVAPIPGKSAVGIEIPNKSTSLVTLRDVVDSPTYQEGTSPIRFALGKGISGAAIIADLATMPHLLIAGATGSGKSVCVNTIISSILLNARPDEVKFLMIDPKVVELGIYNEIPHLILPVVTDPKKASIALNWAVEEMEKRYQSFSDQLVRDINSYNDKVILSGEGEMMPRIVVIIDELADLMMVASNQVEESICRLAQKARAAGIHLIVATQRPSVDVITGLIKANIPSRIAFSVSSAIDSRTIIDMGGAEKLLGKGDMLYSSPSSSKPIRVQGSFISDGEVEKLVNYVKAEVGEKVYYDDIDLSQDNSFSNSHAEVDEKLAAAIEFVVRSEKASTSLLQRQFRIGYNRAARMIDELEERGIIGPSRGSKPREVLMTPAELDSMGDR